MIPFALARTRIRSVAMGSDGADPAALADGAALWGAITGTDDPRPLSHAEAVADTYPQEHAATLGTMPTAAAVAWSEHHADASRAERISPVGRRDAARAAWERYAARADALAKVAHSFGWSLADAWEHAADVATSTVNLATVQAIARLAGRMHAALRGATAVRRAEGREEAAGVEIGGDVGRLLPDELGAIVDPDLGDPSLVRLVDRRMLQIELRGRAKATRGPLVVCLDESSSMHADRRTWSKAAAAALARVAREDRRAVAVVHFSTATRVRHLRTPADTLDMIRHWFGGGTEIARALTVAADAVAELRAKGEDGADVVLVSDGEDGDTAGQTAALDKLGKLGVRLWTVAIQCDVSAAAPIRARAAGYARVDALQDGATARSFAGAAG